MILKCTVAETSPKGKRTQRPKPSQIKKLPNPELGWCLDLLAPRVSVVSRVYVDTKSQQVSQLSELRQLRLPGG